MSSQPYFDHVASNWDKLRSEFFAESVRETAVEALQVAPNALAADLGAGSGFVTEALLERGLQVLAVDQSSAMLAIMRGKFGDNERVEYRVGQAAELPIAEHSVDYVFANMYLHHVDDPVVAIKEIARILRPGGRVALTDLDKHGFEFLRAEHHDRWLGFLHHDVARWLAESGLVDVDVRPIGSTCSALSADRAVEAKIGIFLATAASPSDR